MVSIPVIALAQGFQPLVLGRLLQGISAGLIGVVVRFIWRNVFRPRAGDAARPFFNGC